MNITETPDEEVSRRLVMDMTPHSLAAAASLVRGFFRCNTESNIFVLADDQEIMDDFFEQVGLYCKRNCYVEGKGNHYIAGHLWEELLQLSTRNNEHLLFVILEAEKWPQFWEEILDGILTGANHWALYLPSLGDENVINSEV